MTDKEVRNEIYKIQKKASKTSRICMFPKCANTAINSHLLQKNGIISEIAESQHVMEIINQPFAENLQIFKKTGHKDIFTFPGFCDKHDNTIFEPIEGEVIDFEDYQSQLLFVYRALVNERSKKIIIIDTNNRILESRKLKSMLSIGYIHHLQDAISGSEAGIKDNLHFESMLLSNLGDVSKRNFKFIIRRLPRYEICASGVFTYETTEELINMGANIDEPLTEIYFNLLPTENELILIIGCHNDYKDKCWEYISQFESIEDGKVLKLISNILLCQMENWTTSISFYNKYLAPKDDAILKTMIASVKDKDERRYLNINIFSTMPK